MKEKLISLYEVFLKYKDIQYLYGHKDIVIKEINLAHYYTETGLFTSHTQIEINITGICSTELEKLKYGKIKLCLFFTHISKDEYGLRVVLVSGTPETKTLLDEIKYDGNYYVNGNKYE